MRSLSDHVLHEVHRATDGRPRGRLPLVVAVSGGCDSMVLLHALRELAVAHRWRLVVAHFNHQLRGRHSSLDAALVTRTCKGLGIRCIVGRGNVAAHAKRQGLSVEMAARELRHRFLAQTARRHKCRWIATAHHADDQAELVLLRLLRGSGSEGLAGMGVCDPSPADARLSLLRPLLSVSRHEIVAYAEAEGVRFREDASNRSVVHLRNRIRRELLPMLRRDFQPAVDRVLCRVAEVLRGENEWMAQETAAWLRRRQPSFGRLPLALRRRVLLLQGAQLGVALDFDTVGRILESPGEVVNVSGDRFLRLDARGELTVVRPPAGMFNKARRVVVLDGRTCMVSFGGLTLRFRIVRRRGQTRPVSLPCRERFDAEAVGKRILLRHWRSGDRFQPIGMKTAVKLQDLFTNAKVPVAERRARVVAEAESGALFWVQGLRIGEGFKLTPSTRQQLDWAWDFA